MMKVVLDATESGRMNEVDACSLTTALSTLKYVNLEESLESLQVQSQTLPFCQLTYPLHCWAVRSHTWIG